MDFKDGVEKLGDLLIQRIKLTVEGVSNIKISFDKFRLSDNAEMYIYNPDKTIITGPISKNENIQGNRIWSSNSFPDSSIIIEIKSPVSEAKNNQILISKIFVSTLLNKFPIIKTQSDSLLFGHFNTSSSCNINVLCSQGNNYVNERKAVCMIESQDMSEFASGALLMNTCSTNIPYLLTAKHVTDVIACVNASYYFGWWSSTCTPNTNNQTAYLFNGANLVASNPNTDFSLLQLFQTPPSNYDITYLGWSRSSVAPTSSVGIHHPQGDQMKISFAANPASIGTINSTYPNAAWRVLWTWGTDEPGSSGSPLFDPNKKVVGQLSTGTQPIGPPCNVQTGGSNYGRFDLSWTGGSTHSTQLSYWLDPSNSGATTTNTTNIASLLPPLGILSISGNDGICSGTSQYTLKNNGTPLTENVTWVSSNTNIASVTPTGNPATVTRTGNGNVTITATIARCDGNHPVSKNIVTGVPDNSTFKIYQDPTCNNSRINFGAYTGSTFDNCSLWNMGVTNITWDIPSYCCSFQITNNSGPGVCANGLNNSGIQVYFSNTYIYNAPYIRYKAQNACGWSDWMLRPVPVDFSACGSSYFTVAPNPANSSVDITITGESLQTDNAIAIREIQITDKMGKVVKQLKYTAKTSKVTLDISMLKQDVYFIRVYNGKEWETESISKQ